MLEPLERFFRRVGCLILLDRAVDPAANGHVQRNGTHIKAYSGGAVRSLSDVHAQLHATAHQPGGGDAMAVDAAAATGSLRTLGTTALKAAAGDHTHGATAAANLDEVLRDWVEDNAFKCVYMLGAAYGTVALDAMVGLGVRRKPTNGTFEQSALIRGGWIGTTAAGAGDEIHVQGGQAGLDAAADWHLIARVLLPNEASRNFVFGLTDNNDPADVNNMIAWTVSGQGNYIGKCDNAGVETLRDTAVAATDAVEHRFRIEISANGTIVKFFFDNAQVGADVTTNIPTSTAMYLMCGVKTSAAAAKSFHIADMVGFREV